MADFHGQKVDRQGPYFELFSTAPKDPPGCSEEYIDSDFSHVGGESLEVSNYNKPPPPSPPPQIPSSGKNDPEGSGVEWNDPEFPTVGPDDIKLSNDGPIDPEYSTAVGMNDPDFTSTGMDDPELSDVGGLNDPKLLSVGGNDEGDFSDPSGSHPRVAIPAQSEINFVNLRRDDLDVKEQRGPESPNSRTDGPEFSRRGWRDYGFPVTAWNVPGGSIAGQRNPYVSGAERNGEVAGHGMVDPRFLSSGPRVVHTGQTGNHVASATQSHPIGLVSGPGFRVPVFANGVIGPENSTRRANIRGFPVSRGQGLILGGIPARDPQPPIVARDIPVSDTEMIIPRTVPAHVESRGAERKTKKTRLCVLAFVVVCVGLAAAVLGTVYSNRKSDSNGQVHKKKPVSVKGAVGLFHGSFLLTDYWNDQMSDVRSYAFQSLAKRLETLIDEIYGYSPLSRRFSHSSVIKLSKHGSKLIQVTVNLKLKDDAQDEHKPNLIAADLQEAFLNGRLRLLNSVMAGRSHKDLAVKIIADSLSIAAGTASSARTTTTSVPTRSPAERTTWSPAERTTWGPAERTTWRPAERTTEKLPDFPCGEIRVLPDVRVIGGSEARRGVYPWIVMMLKNGAFHCAGSILDRWTILTAAHCLSNEPKDYLTGLVNTRTNDITIIAGKHEADTSIHYYSEQRILAKSGYMHSDFQITDPISNDIAVLRLSRPLQFNTRVAPLCLPAVSNPLPPVCVVAGWGAVDFENEDLPPALRTATVRAYNRTACQSVFQSTFGFRNHSIGFYLVPGTMCSANGTFGGINTCHGDSGGPLFCLHTGADGERRYTQFGIVSWGKWCGEPGVPDFFTYVPQYLSWLRSEALPALEKPTRSGDWKCRSFSPLTDYEFYECRSKLRLLRQDSQCRNITEVVWCVLQALKKNSYDCQPQDVYNTIVSSSGMDLSSLQRRHCQERYNSSELVDPRCRTFSPMTEYTFNRCRVQIRQLMLDSQCRNISQVVSCYMTVLDEYDHYCRREDVFTTIVNSKEVNLSPQQRRHCQANRPSTSSQCSNLTAISSAFTVCTNNTSCVSMLEVTLCVHAVLDPNWLLCSRQDLQDVISTHLNASLRICEDYTVRTMMDGRHFMYVNGDWFVLCGNHWSQTETEVACRQGGFKHGEASYIHRTEENVYVTDRRNTSFDALHYVKASGWMAVTCLGLENSLGECSLKRQLTCATSYIAASVCYNTAYKFTLRAPLQDSAYGYIQHIRDEDKGYVCVPDLSDRAAHLLCREAGYVAGMAYSRGLASPLSDVIWETEMQCGAGAVDVNGCTHGNWTFLQRSTGSCAQAQVFCFSRKVRLHNGLFNSTGIVQMYQKAQNGHDVTLTTVCREGFDDVAAGILCRQIGFAGVSHSLQFNPFYKPNTEYVRVKCRGKEVGLEGCDVRNVNLGTCMGPAVVKCYTLGNKEPDLSVRLTNPDSEVQVSVDGQWGTICTDHWTDNEAAALCRQLGHLYGYRHFTAFEAHPRRNVPHVLHNVRCGVNATSLDDCSYDLVDSDICQHVRAAAVQCLNYSIPVYSLHNESITVPNQGVVYVNYNGTTAPLKGYLSSSTISALCQTFGYVTGERTYVSSFEMRVHDSVWWSRSSRVSCSDVHQCLPESLELINCSDHFQHRQYECEYGLVTVRCYSSAVRLHSSALQQHTSARQTTGIVQVYRNGRWWEVCHDHITQSAADVICHDIMGTPTASAVLLRDVYRLGSYPTVKASVFCDPRDPGMTSSDCVVLDLSSKCESFNSDPASVACYDGSRPSGAISGWKLDDSKVWVKRYGTWGTVCGDLWSGRAASLFCKHVGFKHGYASSQTPKRDSTVALWAWSVNCSLSATDLESCHVNLTNVVTGRCFFDHDAMVDCDDYY